MAFFFVQRALAAEKPVKVFILAGQSNMEGKGFPRPLAWQVSQPAYQERLPALDPGQRLRCLRGGPGTILERGSQGTPLSLEFAFGCMGGFS